jgi:2-oxoglutarate dehydrogenase E2 component (dihydrolipoamide succinyltransferase)
MARDVKIPSLGESVSEATLGRWLKQDGEAVAADEPILELESDKANMELAAETAGTLRILTGAGATVHFGDVVGRIEAGAAKAATATASAEAVPPAAVAKSAEAPGSEERPLSPAVRRIVEEEKLDPAQIVGTGPGGRILKADALAAADRRKPAAGESEPAAAGGARGVLPSALAAAVAGRTAAPAPPPPAGVEGEDRVPMSRLRQVIARRLVESQQSTATLTTFNEVDMGAILELRARHKESFQKKHGVSLGFMGFFVAACCEAMGDVPEVNARIDGNDVVYPKAVHVGVAVGTDRGLVVPVVRDASSRSIAQIEAEIARLAELARTSKLVPDDLAGATFTISNGGVYGSLLSTPILNPPQSAILGMHKIEKRPVVVDDQVVVRPMMYLALSYDHRLIDGKGAVTYLVRVKERLEDPARLLLRV